MQAKNYAAQVASEIHSGDILKKAQNFTDIELFHDKAQVSIFLGLLASIKSSTNFNVPDSGKILGATKEDYYPPVLEENTKLPFSGISLMFDDNNGTTKHLVHAIQHDEEIKIFTFFNPENKGWNICPKFMKMRGNLCCQGYIFDLKKEYKEKEDDLEMFLSHAIRAVLELLEALSCRNVVIDNAKMPKLGSRGIENRKMPFYESKILTIKVTKNQGVGTRTGAHESPRQHLRRGHIRRLESGNIWVNACVVGSSEKGVIKKSYNVAA
jgi:hypothetical protein